MKLAILALALCATTASLKAAVTVSISTAPTGAQFFLSGGTTVLADGTHIRVGTFASAPAAGATFTQLAAAFDEFTFTTSGSSSAPNTGRTNKTNLTGAITGSPDSAFVGTKIYLWVYSAASSGSGIAPTGETLQQGVFSTSVATATFKDQATAVALSTANLDQAFGSYEGGTPAQTLGAAGSVTKLTLASAPIPEPSGSILALLGLGLLSRRKR